MDPILEYLAAIYLEEGDLWLLAARFKARKTLTEAERRVVEQVLEAAAAGKKGWRPPKRPKQTDAQQRRLAYGVIYHYHHFRLAYSTGSGQPVLVRSHRDALKFVGKRYRRGTSRIEYYLGIARRDPLIMGDATIKAQAAAFERADTVK